MGAALVAWHDVFLAGAGAAAVLLGLLFVAGSIHQTNRETGSMPPHTGWRHLLMNRYAYDSEFEALGTQTYLMFIYTLVFSLVVLVPFEAIVSPGFILVGIGGLGLVETTIPIVGVWRRPVRPGVFEQLWRYWLPEASMAAVIGGGVLIAMGLAHGLDAVACGTGLLLFGAARNAWDLFLMMGLD